MHRLLLLLCWLPGLVMAQAGDAFVRREAFVRLSLSKTACYEGEPILATYQLFRSINTQSQVISQPSFDGFAVQEMTTNASVQTEQVIAGKLYKVDVVRKVMLTPLQPGQFAVGSLSVEHVVPVPEAGRNLVVRVSSAPVNLAVKALPASAAGAAIGRFQLSARYAQPSLWVGGTDTLVLRVEGSGNFARLPAPQVQWSAGVRAYATELEEDSVNKLSFPLTGSVQFSIPFTLLGRNARLPREAVLTVFDPATGRVEKVVASLPALQILDKAPPKPVLSAQRPGFYRWLPALALLPLLVAFSYFFIRRRQRPVAQTAAAPEQSSMVAAEEHQHSVTGPELSALVKEPAQFWAAAEQAMKALPLALHQQPAYATLLAQVHAARYGNAAFDPHNWLTAYRKMEADA